MRGSSSGFSVGVVGSIVGFILACTGGAKDEGGGLLGEDISQDEACAAYLDCLAAVDPGSLAAVQSTYGADGTCWADASSAATCADACVTGLEQMDEAFPAEAACDDGGPATAGDLEGAWQFTPVDQDDGCEEYGLVLHALDLQIAADGDSAFTGQGDAELEVVGNIYNLDVDLECTLSGDDFSCDRSLTDYDTYWTFSGSLAGGGIDATMEVLIGDGAGDEVCTEVVGMEGEWE